MSSSKQFHIEKSKKPGFVVNPGFYVFLGVTQAIC